MKFFNNSPDRKWTDELKNHKINRISWLKNKIIEVENKLKENLSDWDRLRYSLYKDQLMIDLREDKHFIKYEGKIPKHLNERCVRKAQSTFDKYRKSLGNDKFMELYDDVDVNFWQSVIIGNKTTGGGKV